MTIIINADNRQKPIGVWFSRNNLTDFEIICVNQRKSQEKKQRIEVLKVAFILSYEKVIFLLPHLFEIMNNNIALYDESTLKTDCACTYRHRTVPGSVSSWLCGYSVLCFYESNEYMGIALSFFHWREHIIISAKYASLLFPLLLFLYLL